MNETFAAITANLTNVSYNYRQETSTSQTTEMGNIGPIQTIPELMVFNAMYKSIHGYLAAFVCVFGVIANILNIIVLTRKNMQTSTNVILTGLAISDGLTMAAYFPYALILYVIHGTEDTPKRNTYQFAQFLMGYAIFSVVVHSISIWLTVTLALFRFIFIRFPRRGALYCNIDRAKIAVISVVIVVTIVCVPNAVNLSIEHQFHYDPSNITGNGTLYYVSMKKNTTAEKILHAVNFWIQAIIIKLLPSFLLTIFSILLVSTMRQAEKRRRKLLNNVPMSEESGAASTAGNCRKHKKNRSNRTTRMLLAVVILFLITETPQGVLSLLGALDLSFFTNVYIPLADLLDILALINNGINFVLYCSMSKQFRDTFIKIFLKNVLHQDFQRTNNAYNTIQATQATKDSDL